MQRRITVRGIVINDKGHLLAQKFRQEDGSESDYWGTPGGGLDPGEILTDCLHREMIEETGIAPTIGKLLFMQQYTSTHPDGSMREYLEFFYHVENYQDYETIDLSKTTHGQEELTRCEFVDANVENILPKFLQEVNLQSAINGTSPVMLATYMQQ